MSSCHQGRQKELPNSRVTRRVYGACGASTPENALESLSAELHLRNLGVLQQIEEHTFMIPAASWSGTQVKEVEYRWQPAGHWLETRRVPAVRR